MSDELPLPTVWVRGQQVPGWFMLDGKLRIVPCPCVDTPDEECAYHGKHPYMVCEDCNYDRHMCGGCGSPLEHGANCYDCAREAI